MTREQAIQKLKELQVPDDVEGQHCDADDVLCDLLTALGFADVVDEFKKIDRWYA